MILSDFPTLRSHTSSKSVPPAPRGQGEIGGFVHLSQAQAQTRVSICSRPVGFSHHDDQVFSVEAICGQDVVVETRVGDGGSGSSISVVGVGGKRIETKHVSLVVRKVMGEHSKEVEQEMSMMKKMEERDGVSGRMLLVWSTGWGHRRTKGKGIME